MSGLGNTPLKKLLSVYTGGSRYIPGSRGGGSSSSGASDPFTGKVVP